MKYVEKIKIVTDSTADIPQGLAEELGITIVPLNVIFSNEESYEDGVTLKADDFYRYVKERNHIPSTSQPTPFQFEEVYRSLLEEDDTTIISIHISSKLSGTYQAATIAVQSLEAAESIHVVDSKRASYAIGIIVVELAILAREGKSSDEIRSRLNELLDDTQVYFMVDTLEYLQKNGRIGRASALLGSMLKIKPILSLTEEGEVYSFEKARGQKKATNRIIEVLQEQYGSEPIHVGISHAVNEEYAKEVLALLKEKFDIKSEVITTIGAVIGAHVGPGTVAISVSKAK
nr:DegV family protein [Bacillus suaedae]